MTAEGFPPRAPADPHRTESEIERAYERVAAWCRARGYAGYDPFDALNSRAFQSLPLLKRTRAARLVWTQLLKRSPLNLRPLVGVPAERNAKGTALFALAALARLRTRPGEVAAQGEARARLADLLAERLAGAGGVSEKGEGAGGGRAWGYNFDWQGRAFFAPRGTPTIVPTAFAVRALVEAELVFQNDGCGGAAAGASPSEYLGAARGACDFILRGLNRSVDAADEICFSYTPLDRTRVFNASLLGAEALASVGALTGEAELRETALRAARYVIRRQRADGSWAYGEDAYQSWADNFHTAFILTSLARIRRACGGSGVEVATSGASDELAGAIRRGLAFWRERFFLADGWPKYYHDRTYPADAHSAAAAIIALLELREFDAGACAAAERVARWSLRELFDARGFFYYQRRRFHTVRTAFMRWSQAWMMYALARLLETMNGER